jgi:predicted permease
VPTAMAADFLPFRRDNPTGVWVSILARLHPGVSLEQASARLAAASASIEESLPKDRANAKATYIMVDASKGLDRWRTRLHDPLVILMGTVTLVLLVACANLANLLLARTNERQQEFAIKLALGISRWRLMRQALLETVLLALAGGAAALLLAGALTRFLLQLFNSGNSYQVLNVAPDASVFLYTLCGCLLTALVAGLYPAWRASCSRAGPGLKGAALHGHQRSFVRRSLILVQVALAVVLLFGASLFSHSLRNLKLIDLGFDMDRVLTVDIGDSGPRKNVRPQVAPPALAAVLERVRQLPGVASAAFTKPGPLSGGMMWATAHVTDAAGRRDIDTNVMFAGTDFFRTLRMPILRGRVFTAVDRKGAPPVLIVNEQLASLLAPGRNPIGMHIDASDLKDAEIVGVVGNSKYQGVREETKAIIYEPFDQAQVTGGVLEIRCRAGMAAVDRDVRGIVRASAPRYQVSDVTPLNVMRDNIIAQDRLLSFLSTLFGALGTALALVGIYGLISYSVTRRTREIGIRISVGAQTSDVLWLVLREALLLVAAGVLAGLPLALRLSETIRKMLYQVSSSDPLDIWMTIVLMAAGGLVASWIPGRRAARTDPVRALRYD